MELLCMLLYTAPPSTELAPFVVAATRVSWVATAAAVTDISEGTAAARQAASARASAVAVAKVNAAGSLWASRHTEVPYCWRMLELGGARAELFQMARSSGGGGARGARGPAAHSRVAKPRRMPRARNPPHPAR